MKRSLVVLFAVLALALLLAGPANAAPTGVTFHRAATSAQVAQAAPTVTPSSTTSVTTTPAVVTKTKTDRRGLLGLIGLLGLLGLLKRPRKEVETIVSRPVSRVVADPTIDRPRQ